MILLNNVVILDKNIAINFDLHIKPLEFVAIAGASGAGKSTLLNIIAGFEQIDSGEIWLNNINHTNSQPFIKPVSILFQENNLFEHLSVFKNISFGLTTKKPSNPQIDSINIIANRLKISQYLTNYPTELSGGEKQRVAIARSLLRNQPILLLDEPFSALDHALRLEMMNILSEIHKQQKLTILLVTHQLNELPSDITRIVTIDKGIIISNQLVN